MILSQSDTSMACFLKAESCSFKSVCHLVKISSSVLFLMPIRRVSVEASVFVTLRVVLEAAAEGKFEVEAEAEAGAEVDVDAGAEAEGAAVFFVVPRSPNVSAGAGVRLF